jgi:hypothetical protein
LAVAIKSRFLALANDQNGVFSAIRALWVPKNSFGLWGRRAG